MTQKSTWNGCYNGSLKELIVPEAFKHPAKMSRLLCERIFDHGKEKGYWQPGDMIIDPFGGIGTTGIIGAYRGYKVISIEPQNAEALFKKGQFLHKLGRPVEAIEWLDKSLKIEHDNTVYWYRNLVLAQTRKRQSNP